MCSEPKICFKFWINFASLHHCCISNPLFNFALPSPLFHYSSNFSTLYYSAISVSRSAHHQTSIDWSIFMQTNFSITPDFINFYCFLRVPFLEVSYKVCGWNREQFTWKRVGLAFEIMEMSGKVCGIHFVLEFLGEYSILGETLFSKWWMPVFREISRKQRT